MLPPDTMIGGGCNRRNPDNLNQVKTNGVYNSFKDFGAREKNENESAGELYQLHSSAYNIQAGFEAPDCYDFENASSIVPSDIDIVYHYKVYRDGTEPKGSLFHGFQN